MKPAARRARRTGARAAQAWPRVKIRVELSAGCAVGPGKIALLEAIEAAGSLSVAARNLDMSYRRAWNLLDDLNRCFAEPVATTAVGGVRGGGARITDNGRALIREFREFELAALRLAGRRMRAFRVSRESAAAVRPRTAARARRT